MIVLDVVPLLVVADIVFDGALEPTEFIADTRYVYAVLGARPESEYVVEIAPVLDTTVDHVVPLSAERSILYPIIAEPPLLDGAVQERLICDDAAVAVRPVGDPGTVVVTVPDVVADAVLDGALEPTEFIADTR